MEKKTLLLIDDEKDFCFLIKEHIEGLGDFIVHTAGSGAKGLEAAKRIRPDLIILDLVMPEMDGFTVLQQLKKDAICKEIPVIILTALESHLSKLKAMKLYDEYYLVKPVDAKDLIIKIEEVLKIRNIIK